MLEIFPILRDFELSVWKADFNMYIAAIRRSLPLFFATGRSNYSRWVPLFYQDCLDLQRKFPDLYRHFKNGHFVCRMTNRSNSCIGFDQALEKSYNYTSKASGGVIGYTKEKKAIALWDILKHEKDQFVSFIKNMTNISEDSDELNLHHDFNANVASKTMKQVESLTDYIKTVGNPFMSGNRFLNILTHEEIPLVKKIFS